MTDFVTLLIPMFIIMTPALIVWQMSKSKDGLLGGAVLGIIIAYSSGIVGSWAVLLGVLGTASLFVQERIRK